MPYRIERSLAVVLAIGGSFFAILLLISILFPPHGFLINLVFVPGWMIYAGWCKIALDRLLGIRHPSFWICSVVVHVVYFTINWFYPSRPLFSDVVSWWFVAVVCLSMVCFVLCRLKKEPPKRLLFCLG